jgi:serine/threonine-protein kinase
MNHDEPPSPDGTGDEAFDESDVARGFDAYLADLEAGRAVDPARLLAEHPAIADQLRACLDVMHLADQLDVSSGAEAQKHLPAVGGRWPGRVPGTSQLTTLDLDSEAVPHVQLRDLHDNSDPLVKLQSTEMPAQNGAGVCRYQLQGEIARGGMGAILKGRDADPGRDLAIKVLLESHRGNTQLIQRFIEEAQIGGQLQHPGIVPVYDLGTFADRRPFFAMKLVKGRTLAEMLADRDSVGWVQPINSKGSDNVGTGGLHPPYQDLPRFLSIFEAVCQTMAYAHARGVVHRDLKPSNVMVGSFGEVQVMDWGLAKVLPRGGVADEHPEPPANETVIMTVRSGSDADASHAGSVLGTPSYMSPEQARGEAERIDERSDVFGLGAILCEILTGKPPFLGRDRHDIRDQAARGNLTEALVRLDDCGADADLVALCRDCLAADPFGRPRNGEDVSRRMTAYLAGVQDRLRAAELARVEAQTRAAEERKRRRLAVALAASVLATASVLGGGWAYLARQRTARLLATSRVVNEALAEAERLRGQAELAAIGDLAKWSEAIGAAKRARDLLAEGEADDALHNRVASALANLERERAAAKQRATQVERDHKFLSELETIRGRRSEHWDAKQADTEYGVAFRSFGIDLDQLEPEESGKRIAQRSGPIEMAAYLDDWALQRRQAREKKDEASWRRLLAAARVADPDLWGGTLRTQVGRDGAEVLRRLAADEKGLEAQPARSLVLLGLALKDVGDPTRAEHVLRLAWKQEPGDFWVNVGLGLILWLGDHYDRPEAAVRYFSAAVSIRPRSSTAHVDLGIALADQRKLEEAVEEYRTALRLKQDHPEAHFDLGHDLAEQGKLDEAIVEVREALRLKPDLPGIHTIIGYALDAQGKTGEAIAEYREELQLHPDFAEAHFNLGLALRDQARFTEAIAELRKARDLAKRKPRLAQRIDGDLAAIERQATLALRLPAVLTGKLKPAGTAETLGFARLCYDKKQHGASARLWTEAFQARSNLAEDMTAQNRYNAACAAALAGSGQGKDEPPLDEAAKARWRKQAVEWLKADLAYWTRQVESGPAQDRAAVAQTLQHWKVDPDLAGIRDEAGLSKIPEDERKACRGLWPGVNAVLKRAGRETTESKDTPASRVEQKN